MCVQVYASGRGTFRSKDHACKVLAREWQIGSGWRLSCRHTSIDRSIEFPKKLYARPNANATRWTHPISSQAGRQAGGAGILVIRFASRSDAIPFYSIPWHEGVFDIARIPFIGGMCHVRVRGPIGEFWASIRYWPTHPFDLRGFGIGVWCVSGFGFGSIISCMLVSIDRLIN